MAKLMRIAALLAATQIVAPMAPAAAAQVGGDAAACAEGLPAIRTEIVGLKDRTGRLKLELYPATPDDFLRDDRDLVAAGKTFRRVWAQVPASGPVALCIRVPRPGTYALFFTHDRDGKNKFNIWNDGAGLPTNQRIGRAKPALAGALITVGARTSAITIRAQYLHGFPPSFSPLKD